MIYKTIRLFIVLIIGSSYGAEAAPKPQAALKVHALVLGSGEYNDGDIVQVKNDLTAMKNIFLALKFDVTQQQKRGFHSVKQAMMTFNDKLKDGTDLAIIFYSGHGFSYKGENYIIPGNSELPAALAMYEDGKKQVPINLVLQRESIALKSIIHFATLKAKTVMVIINACRNNFINKGNEDYLLTPVKINKNYAGSNRGNTNKIYFMYSTALNTPSHYNKKQRHTHYTQALIDVLGVKNKNIKNIKNTSDFAGKVEKRVKKKTKNKQKPDFISIGNDDFDIFEYIKSKPKRLVREFSFSLQEIIDEKYTGTTELKVASGYKGKGKDSKIGFLSGGKSGIYLPLASDMNKITGGKNSPIKVISSTGSIGTIDQLFSTKNAGIGIVQDDAFEYTPAGKEHLKGSLRLVFPLHDEYIHILALKKSRIKNLRGLKGKKVYFSKWRSGTNWTMRRFFGLADIETRTGGKANSFYEAIEELLLGEIDAIGYVSGLNAPFMQTMNTLLGDPRFLNIPKMTLVNVVLPRKKKKTDSIRYYRKGVIGASIYNNMIPKGQQVKTYVVRSLLVEAGWDPSTNKLSKHRCKQIRSILYGMKAQKKDLREEGHHQWKNINLDFIDVLVKGNKTGAWKNYRDNHDLIRGYYKRWGMSKCLQDHDEKDQDSIFPNDD